MRTLHATFCSHTAAILLILHTATCARSDDILHKQYEAEAYKMLQQYRNTVLRSNLFADEVVSSTNNNASGMRSKYQRTVKILDGDSYMFSYTPISPLNKQDLVKCINRDYFFELSRPNVNWVITAITTRKTESDNLLDIINATDRPDYAIEQSLCTGMYCHYYSMLQLINDNGFTITSIGHAANNQDYVELKFDARASKLTDPAFVSGTLTLMPKQFWLIDKYEIKMYYGKATNPLHYKLAGKNVYRNDVLRNIPLPSSRNVQITSLQTTKKNDVHMTYNYTYYPSTELRKSDFTLSAYGLPEPALIKPQSFLFSNGWFIYSAVFGLLCMMIGVFIRGRSARSKCKATTGRI